MTEIGRGLRFDPLAVREYDASPHEWDELGAVELSPVRLRDLEQLEGHDEPGGAGAGFLRNASRSRTVAKVDSIAFVVRKCFQCSAG